RGDQASAQSHRTPARLRLGELRNRRMPAEIRRLQDCHRPPRNRHWTPACLRPGTPLPRRRLRTHGANRGCEAGKKQGQISNGTYRGFSWCSIPTLLTPLTRSFEIKDLAGDSLQIFEE